MSKLLTFRGVLSVLVVIATLITVVLVAHAFFKKLLESPFTPPTQAAQGVQALPEPPALYPSLPAAPLAPYDAVVFTAVATSSMFDEPHVALFFKKTDEPCVEPPYLQARSFKVKKGKDSISDSVKSTWCLKLAKGQSPVAHVLPGEYATLSQRLPGIVSANQYLKVQHSSGKWLGVRATALAHCEDDEDVCALSVMTEVSIDDRNFVVPFNYKGRWDMAQLVSGAKLESLQYLKELEASTLQEDSDITAKPAASLTEYESW